MDRLGGDQSATIRSWLNSDQGDRKTAGPPGEYKPRFFADPNVYVGPALLLHALRDRLGDPRFFAMLHDWVQQHRYTTADRDQFTRWLTTYTGENFTTLITQWLDSATTPQLHH